jgi:serine protease
MLRLRLGLFGLATVVAALLVGGAVGHSQAPDSAWRPASVIATDRGIDPVPVGVRGSPSARRRRLRPGDKRGRRGAPYRAGRVIVKFRNGTSAAARSSALLQASRTAKMGAHPAGGDFDLVNIDPNEDAEAAAAVLAARPDVEYAQAAYRVYAYAADTFVPNDTNYAAYQWNFTQIDLERGWFIQRGATPSIVVAVLDTGVAFQSGTLSRHAFAFCSENEFAPTCPPGGGTSYPDIGNLTIPFARASDLSTDAGRFVSPADFIWGTPEDAQGVIVPASQPLDLVGHGTHVASTIGELTNNNFGLAGIAFNASIMPVKVIDGDWDDIFHSPNQGTDDTVALGIRWAADHGANVINMSIGRSGDAAPTIESAIRYAVGKGCFVAIAGGNGALEGNDTEVIAEIASRVPGAVSVGAVDRQARHASYSNTGAYIELTAPGGDGDDYIYQQTYDYTMTDTFALPVNQYKAPRFDILGGVGYQGTSMSTPHVSGVAALLMAQGIKNPAAIEAALEHFATDLGAAGRDDLYGFGEVNARNTLRGLGLSK